ncbi:hypothetical protein AAFF_G00283410 [Aldrovandia affinis]|uniref:Uncharacterized protein n=1 Tax=Aldrovandia affinis TaxID=143900 RepID=A0AAD7T9Z1_9TELE|nr:hypothetical protein AAFF_G00283410 [Aldrovandia affinis]
MERTQQAEWSPLPALRWSGTCLFKSWGGNREGQRGWRDFQGSGHSLQPSLPQHFITEWRLGEPSGQRPPISSQEVPVSEGGCFWGSRTGLQGDSLPPAPVMPAARLIDQNPL